MSRTKLDGANSGAHFYVPATCIWPVLVLARPALKLVVVRNSNSGEEIPAHISCSGKLYPAGFYGLVRPALKLVVSGTP